LFIKYIKSVLWRVTKRLSYIGDAQCLKIKPQWFRDHSVGETKIPHSAHSVFMCLVWTSKQAAIISLYSVNWLAVITQSQCVYCAVRTQVFKNKSFKVFVTFVHHPLPT